MFAFKKHKLNKHMKNKIVKLFLYVLSGLDLAPHYFMFLKNYIAKYPDTHLGQPGRFQVPCFHFVAYLPFSSSKKQSEVDVRL